jgi:quinone-modifying oxidoreductase subunit QmoA
MTGTEAPLLVVGAGIAGVTAALEAAEAGRDVVLLEKEATVGGRVLRNHRYFPKLCPPSCGMEINTRRLERSPRVRVITQAEVVSSRRGPGGHEVTLRRAPQYVNERCTACGACSAVCPSRIPDPFNMGMSEAPAIRLPHSAAWPFRFILDRTACADGCKACVEACRYEAIDLDAQVREETLTASAIVVATGWTPYPLEKLPELGGGRHKDVVANVQVERMASAGGPTAGKILRPSTGEPPRRVAFIQCAGSRDVNHLAYCSAVCCLASLKQALYVHEQIPGAEITIYYIDRRTPGRGEDLLERVAALEGVRLVKGKVGSVDPAPEGDLVLKLEDVESGRLVAARADLVVLATGMVPNLGGARLPFELARDEDGFGLDGDQEGVVVAGVARRPTDVASSVRDATGAAARALVAAGGK